MLSIAAFVKLQKALEEKLRVLHTEEAFNGYKRTTKQQVNEQDIDTPLSRGRQRPRRGFRKKWPGLLRPAVLLLDDNARPYLATAMQNHIATRGRERLHHPPHSPDLAPSGFHLLQTLKKTE
ncbi:histone-lysine N-methyltransferase SETMAR [Trichonephila clavipes]|nr:histone-lysine N-methyltransferase SETMAR [Trichonephila clavipes]